VWTHAYPADINIDRDIAVVKMPGKIGRPCGPQLYAIAPRSPDRPVRPVVKIPLLRKGPIRLTRGDPPMILPALLKKDAACGRINVDVTPIGISNYMPHGKIS
jgi:hypothetical protein